MFKSTNLNNINLILIIHSLAYCPAFGKKDIIENKLFDNTKKKIEEHISLHNKLKCREKKSLNFLNYANNQSIM